MAQTLQMKEEQESKYFHNFILTTSSAILLLELLRRFSKQTSTLEPNFKITLSSMSKSKIYLLIFTSKLQNFDSFVSIFNKVFDHNQSSLIAAHSSKIPLPLLSYCSKFNHISFGLIVLYLSSIVPISLLCFKVINSHTHASFFPYDSFFSPSHDSSHF